MEKYNKLYNVISRIAEYPRVHITQLNNNEFKIELGGELMESYMRLGEIQTEIKNEICEDFEMNTIYGDGQDAIFKFTEINN